MRLELAVPPSTNKLYANAGRSRKKTAAYSAWIRGELKALVAQRAKPVPIPVTISILLPDTMRGDASNRIKATEDLLVRAGIIPNDSKKFVRSISISFHSGPMMFVEVDTIVEKAK